MAGDDRGAKRPAPAGEELADAGSQEIKRPRAQEEPPPADRPLPEVPGSDAPEAEVLRALAEIGRALAERPFGYRASDCQWALRRQLHHALGAIIAAADRSAAVRNAVADLLDVVVRWGYALTAQDRRELVALGAWRPVAAVAADEGAEEALRVKAAMLYAHLAEHVFFYQDFFGKHPEFWAQDVFKPMLQLLPKAVSQVPGEMEAGQWEMVSKDLRTSLRCLFHYLLYWNHGSSPSVDVLAVMPLLDACVSVVMTNDAKFGKEISAKARGEPLEELTKLGGILAPLVLSLLEEAVSERGEAAKKRCVELREQAVVLLRFLVRLLMLRIPTCAPKPDSSAPGGVDMPVDERQQDSDWIEGLYEHCQSDERALALESECVPARCLGELFEAMSQMPLEEQRYRLECVAPLVPPWIGVYKEQLEQKVVPPELTHLKTVMNFVLQDDASMAHELLDFVSFYPCMLEFATKRVIMHACCERAKLEFSNGDPIRLVVPRDEVLDGVCSSLNLKDPEARIEVPLEIEFRAGYSNSDGTELADEGEDQGGLRRQWIDRASRYFVSCDLFTSPSDDAAHLAEAAEGLATTARARGTVFVPAAVEVCKKVQDDWEEQFQLFGCVLGFALLYKETIPVHLGHNFLRAVFGHKTSAEDLLPLLESVDKTLHSKLRYICDGSYRGIGDTLKDVLEQSNLPSVFVINESHCPEFIQATPLKEGGGQIEITEDNKQEFVNLLLNRVLVSGIAQQVDMFRKGLLRVVPTVLVERVAELMSVKEIELMVCGADEIDVDDWMKYTQYENGFTVESQPVKFFWQAVRNMPEQSQAALLSFTTGSSQVPSGGFRFLQPELFTIQRVAVTDRYPEAHTCANTIDLPEYATLEETEKRLLFAINEAGDAFGRR